jgi:hypothetical protein
MIVNHRSSDEFLELSRLDKIPLGLGLGIDLDINLRFKRASFNIVLGHANVGKTYWVLWYLLCLAKKHNLKHLIYSAENSVNGLKRNLIELYAGSKIKDMFLKPKYANAHDLDYEMATKLRLFAKKTNTSIYMCVHAATEALRKTHKSGDYEGMPQAPNMADAEGGGKWGNRADDFIVIHRYPMHTTSWMYTEVHVKKVKETETGGKPTFAAAPVMFRLHNGTQFLNEGKNVL